MGLHVAGVGGPLSFAKKVGRGVGRGAKRAGKFTVRQVMRASKLAVLAACKLPGPARSLAITAALTAVTGGAGITASMVTEEVVAAACRAARSGKKSDEEALRRALEREGADVAPPSLWDRILAALGIG